MPPRSESAKGTKSRCPRSTASRYATIFRATASVARLALPLLFLSFIDQGQIIVLSGCQFRGLHAIGYGFALEVGTARVSCQATMS